MRPNDETFERNHSKAAVHQDRLEARRKAAEQTPLIGPSPDLASVFSQLWSLPRKLVTSGIVTPGGTSALRLIRASSSSSSRRCSSGVRRRQSLPHQPSKAGSAPCC